MRHRQTVFRLFVIFGSLSLGPAVASAQNIHLEALRRWLDKTEEAARYRRSGRLCPGRGTA